MKFATCLLLASVSAVTLKYDESEGPTKADNGEIEEAVVYREADSANGKKESGWTAKFHKRYPNAKTVPQIARMTGIPSKALNAVKRKGMGAYYSSGSRPNQTAQSWGKARMYSYILGGPTRKIDNEITKKYNVKF